MLKQDDVVSENWIGEKEGKYNKKVTEDSVAIYRALKGLTDEEARDVVCGVKSENGIHAWKSLHNNFEPGLNSKKGRVLYEFANMVLKPSKNTDDLRMLLVEMETKIKNVEDITGEVVSSAHAKGVLVGIMDPITRQHTAMQQGENFDVLKKLVKEFVNNAGPRGGGKAPMEIGALEADWNKQAYSPYEDIDWNPGEESYDLSLAVLQGQVWYNCGKTGHIATDCWSPPGGAGKSSGKFGGKKGGGKNFGKGKFGGKDQGKYGGKDSGKGKFGGKSGGKAGKGKGNGPATGCWICKGPHYASACPQNGGGVSSLEEWPSQESEVRKLCSFEEVKKGKGGK